MLAGTGLLETLDEAVAAADTIGYPVMLKATAGGGGIGMRACAGPDELVAAWEAVRRTAGAAFGSAGVYLERLITAARHVEVQVFGDGLGRVVTLGDRDCSLQRRHQKVVEEAPAPRLPAHVRSRIADAARTLAESVDYRSAGTVEFVYDAGAPRGRVPRGQHAAAGGAPGHRGRVRRRPGGLDDPAGPGRHVRRRHPAAPARRRGRGPHLRREPGPRPPAERRDRHRVRAPGPRARRHVDRARRRGLHALRPPAGQGHHRRGRPGERLARARRGPRAHAPDRRRDEPGPPAHDRARPRGRLRAAPHRHPGAPARRVPAHRGPASRHAHARSRTGPVAPGCGTSASRRRGPWTTCRSGWATPRWATPRALRGWSARWPAPSSGS